MQVLETISLKRVGIDLGFPPGLENRTFSSQEKESGNFTQNTGKVKMVKLIN